MRTVYILEKRVDPPQYNRITKKHDITFIPVIKYNIMGRDLMIKDRNWLQKRNPHEDYRIARLDADGVLVPQPSTREQEVAKLRVVLDADKGAE